MEQFFEWASHATLVGHFPHHGDGRVAPRRRGSRARSAGTNADSRRCASRARSRPHSSPHAGRRCRRPKDVASDSQLSSKELLERLFTEHDEITARWLDYELDVAKLIAYPAMSDGRQPLTAAFLRAKKTADNLRPSSASAKVSEQQVAEYLDAVGNAAVAFEVAEKDAKRLRNSTFTEAERKKLDRAQKLLKVAVDDSATQAERNVAYKRVREELDGLIVLSDDAVEVLEKQVAREITASPAPEPAAKQTPPPDPAV